MGVLHLHRSGWFPFCVPPASGIWDGTGFPGPAEVGPGTLYPLGVSLETAMRWYWKAKTWHVASDLVLSGTQADYPFAFSLPLSAGADVPRGAASQGALVCPTPLSYTVDPVLLTLFSAVGPVLKRDALYYPFLRLRLEQAGALTVSSYQGDMIHPKPWPAPASFDGESLPLWFDEAASYDSASSPLGDRGTWTQSRDGGATVTVSELF